jgi:hypothetical protein
MHQLGVLQTDQPSLYFFLPKVLVWVFVCELEDLLGAALK